MSKSKSFFSILLGLAAGTAIGMLYAPDKGWKTRARIRRAAENGYAEIADIEMVKIGADTTLEGIKRDLKINEIYYLLGKALK